MVTMMMMMFVVVVALVEIVVQLKIVSIVVVVVVDHVHERLLSLLELAIHHLNFLEREKLN